VKKAFTLLELLTVIAIMAMMSTLSLGAYRGIVRGMEDRGVIATATLIVSAAQNRARSDHAITAVHFYNVLTQEGDDTPGKQVDYMVHGEAVAVRGVGRFTRVLGNYLADECNDLEQEFEVKDSTDPTVRNPDAKTSGRYATGFAQKMRLFKLTTLDDAKGGGKKLPCSKVLMAAVVGPDLDPVEDFHFEQPTQPDGKTPIRQIPNVCFKVVDDNGIQWRAGDVYAFPFKETVMPNGYVFGTKNDLPTSAKDPVRFVKSIVFDPDDTQTKLEDSVLVHAIRAVSGSNAELRKVGESALTTRNL